MSATTGSPDTAVRRCGVETFEARAGAVVPRGDGGVPCPVVDDLLENFFRVLDTDAPTVVVDLTG
ncbi:hypothetical protein [Saccharothrix longispora]|uniref:hypothetical protein n=1 Tax=Saccharothrix longispora TaxID=33920 RepID=UPI0028FD38B1|nr:hypothetical protein [Saccharothrix longispora]MDU0288976.1 hypothetical protein [Saccharothrix longispora]